MATKQLCLAVFICLFVLIQFIVANIKLQSAASVFAAASFRQDESVKLHSLQCLVLGEEILADLA